MTNEITCFNISWCKLLSYNNGTFGGWVAKNWILCVRVSKWVYCNIDSVPEDPPYTRPLQNHTING